MSRRTKKFWLCRSVVTFTGGFSLAVTTWCSVRNRFHFGPAICGLVTWSCAWEIWRKNPEREKWVCRRFGSSRRNTKPTFKASTSIQEHDQTGKAEPYSRVVEERLQSKDGQGIPLHSSSNLVGVGAARRSGFEGAFLPLRRRTWLDWFGDESYHPFV